MAQVGTKRRRIVIVAIVLVLLSIALATGLVSLARAKRWAQSRNCRSNMISIGLAARLWANDHGEMSPASLASISNELNTTKVLFCPGDREHPRPAVSDWSTFDETACSYEIVTPGIKDGDGSKVFLRCKAHGYLCYGDGSVFDGVSRSARK
jgi:type II secretory pathway pseudopilin PulG